MKITKSALGMKTTLILATLFIGITSFSQNNLFENLEKYEGKVFNKFEISRADGFRIIAYDHEGKTPIITSVKNQYGKKIGLEFNGKYKFRPESQKTDHYSQPAYMRDYNIQSSKFAHVMVEDMLFKLSRTSDDMKTYYIDEIWIPVSELDKKVEAKKAKVEKKEKKKKKSKFGSFMSKMKKKAEDVVANNIAGLKIPDRLKQYKSKEDLHSVIDNYIVEMKKKQASTPLTAKDKSELKGMDDKIKAEDEKIRKANSAYWNSAEGKRHRKAAYGSSSNSSSKKKSSKSGTKTVKVKLHTGRSATFYYVSWNGGKTTIPAANTSYANIPAGTKVYVSKDQNKKKSYLGQVPSGKNSHTFEIK